ncbi:MAG TPA: hypothetical protein VLF20_06030 [Patescibacteria group bacterium]|nr:hypothetical protein [Patescibacteria group bacterium]
MEENQNTQQAPAKNNAIIPVAILALLLIVAVGYFVTQGNTQQTNSTQTVAEQQTTPAPTVTSDATEATGSAYQDGEYAVVGNYISPGGPREIDVTVTLKDGIIVDSTFVGHATDPNSKRFQGEFGADYKTQVIGKPIDEVLLTKVSGSSLTPKGFNDAIEKIKAEAQSSS